MRSRPGALRCATRRAREDASLPFSTSVRRCLDNCSGTLPAWSFRQARIRRRSRRSWRSCARRWSRFPVRSRAPPAAPLPSSNASRRKSSRLHTARRCARSSGCSGQPTRRRWSARCSRPRPRCTRARSTPFTRGRCGAKPPPGWRTTYRMRRMLWCSSRRASASLRRPATPRTSRCSKDRRPPPQACAP